jgi:hypothetical protein
LSDTTPWRNLQKQQIGWDIPLTEKEKFAAAVIEALQMDKTTFEQKSKVVQQYAITNCVDVSTTEAYKNLFGLG